MRENQTVWHREVITEPVEQTLAALLQHSVLAEFYLAGGTGLALHLGHRRSIDLDFFSSEPLDQEALLHKMQKLEGFSLVAKGEQALHCSIGETKVSFLGYPYPVLFPFGMFLGTKIADSRDIACMKISAIASRGSSRDFVDLYTVGKEHGLPELLELFKRKFAQANYSAVHVLKSLTYFDDAEKDPMPDMLVALSWDEVKEFFTKEVPRLL